MKFTLHTARARGAYGIAISTIAMSLASTLPTQANPIFPLALMSAFVPAAGAEDEDDVSLTAAKKSQIAPIQLPEGALRFTSKKQTASLIETLTKFAEKNKLRLGAAETIVWQNGEDVQKHFADLSAESGYHYKAEPTLESEEGKLTLFTCTPEAKATKQSRLYGFWGTNGKTLVLIWAIINSDTKTAAGTSAATDILSEPNTTAPVKPAAATNARSAQEARDGKTPADLLGEWSWTTISGVNYVNTTTNQLASPSGMSCTFTFTRDGHYKKFFYVHQRTYSLVTESTTTEEGTVTFGNGTFTMRPEKGCYKGFTGSRIIDRPMTPEERKPTTFRWEWRKEDGTRRLYIGPNTQSLSLFKPAK